MQRVSQSAELRCLLEALNRDVAGIANGNMFGDSDGKNGRHRADRLMNLDSAIGAKASEGISMMLDTLLAGCWRSTRRSERIARTVRKRIAQDLPEDGGVHNFLAGADLTWAVILAKARDNPALRDEILFELSPLVLRHVQTLAQVARGLGLDRNIQRRWDRERAKRDLARLALEGKADERALRPHALELELDTSGLYSALAFDLPVGAESPDQSSQHREVLDRLARALRIRLDRLVETTYHGKPLAWLPHDSTTSTRDGSARLDAALRQLGDADQLGARIGRSITLRGISSWPTLARQAYSALEIGRAVDGTARVSRYADVAIYDIVSSNDEVVGLLEGVLERLGNEPALIACAETYFAYGQHPGASTARLGIHRNTLRNRLRRIETLLGGNFNDQNWALRLQLALKLRHMRATARFP